MARINIEECWWTDPRRERLAKLLDADLAYADGLAVQMWRLAQQFWGDEHALVPIHVFETLEANAKLIEANLAKREVDGIYVRGSSQYLDWIVERRRAAAKGGKKSGETRRHKSNKLDDKSAKQTRSKSKQDEPSGSYSSSFSSSNSSSSSDSLISDEVEKRPSPGNVECLASKSRNRDANRRAFEAYSDAYQDRYNVEPVRNAKLNANIASFVGRVGEDEAPEIIRFYLRHNDSFYVKGTHSFALALRDAESLRTQWLKGKAITQTDVRQFERRQSQAGLMQAIERGEI